MAFFVGQIVILGCRHDVRGHRRADGSTYDFYDRTLNPPNTELATSIDSYFRVSGEFKYKTPNLQSSLINYIKYYFENEKIENFSEFNEFKGVWQTAISEIQGESQNVESASMFNNEDIEHLGAILEDAFNETFDEENLFSIDVHKANFQIAYRGAVVRNINR